MDNGTPAALTDEQIIERLAVEVMGWVIADDGSRWHETDRQGRLTGRMRKGFWNPLTDWNHWRQVEEKVMEDERVFNHYVKALWETSGYRNSSNYAVGKSVTKAGLPTRCRALLSALNSLTIK